MFNITSKAKNGGIWDGEKLVKVLETEDATVAEHFRAQGCVVEEVTVSIDEMTAAQLKKYAKKNGIELGEATSREDILAVITNATKE